MNSIVGGLDANGDRYLGMIDIHGALIEDSNLVTGAATYFSKPIIWNDWKKDQSEEEVKEIIKKCFAVLFYRDTSAIDK